MDAELLSCGYSYHLKPYRNSYRKGLLHYLFRLQTEGSAWALVNGEMTKLTAGDLLVFQPGEEYELRIEEEQEGDGVASGDYFLFCQGEWIQAWWERYPRGVLTRIELHEELISLWKLLVLARRRVTEENPELSGYLLQALCIQIDEAVTEKPSVNAPFIVTKMMRYIERNATHAFKVADVAEDARLSASRAAHLFKQTQGVSIMQYALKVRLAMAVDRMKYSTLTLEQIAASCGLESYPYFHRVFKAQFGLSPREYRNQLESRE